MSLPPLPAVKVHADAKPWTRFDGIEVVAGDELDFPSRIARDPYALPATPDREGYHGQRHFDYWLSGLKDYLLIRQRLRHATGGAT